jgi:hypothetical protein
MTSQDSWMFRKLAAGYRVYPSPLSSTDLLLKSHKNCVTSTGSRRPLLLYTYWSLARRDGWQRPFWPLALAVVTMIVMGYIAEATDISTYSPLLCPIYLHSVRNPRYQKLFDGKGKQMRAVLATSSPSVGRCIPSRLHARLRNIYCPSRISSTRRFIRSPYKINLSLNAGVAVE